jgi:hypothetical protein
MLLFIMTLGAVVSGLIASSKNRTALGWAVVGFFVPLLSLIILLCLSPLPVAVASEQALPSNRAA